MSNLSDRLKELRGSTSQTEMARQLCIPRTQWIRYETGKNSPSAEMLEKICRIHAVSADWLLGLDAKSAPTVSRLRQRAMNVEELQTTTSQLADAAAVLGNAIKKLKKML